MYTSIVYTIIVYTSIVYTSIVYTSIVYTSTVYTSIVYASIVYTSIVYTSTVYTSIVKPYSNLVYSGGHKLMTYCASIHCLERCFITWWPNHQQNSGTTSQVFILIESYTCNL